MADLFLGRWQLVPELSIFQRGEPPESGITVIQLQGQMCHVAMAWRAVGAEGDQHVGFAAPLTGEIQRNPSAPRGVPNGFSLTRVNNRTLDSSAYIDGLEVMYSRRATTTDGTLMATTHHQFLPNTPATTNYQLYRRIP